jgi:DNA helicase HerA-like ATPase
MWNCSVYCLADNESTSKIVASAYQALLRGENSSVEAGSITVWSDKKTDAIKPWLAKMHHPRLLMANNLEITPTSFISSAELAIHAGIPQASVGGLPVLTMASFGREVVVNAEGGAADQQKNAVRLGRIYHMGKTDTIEGQAALPVCLNKDSLSSHTFVTGSTGSGKSNTVYQILDEIDKQGVRFMVIEPAKGEYKQVFGGRKDVAVYGTNPRKTPLLKINPFRFPDDIHILEHLDRLVEIFNVCWPMYAAMPAVLKDSIEASYRAAGWDLRTSLNSLGQPIFPTFNDVVVNLNRIIDNSAYSDELKGNYKGSLETRLKSLTNGINGMIFVNEELPAETLFDANVIVDLSRVGSMETKALMMGLLVMKLQEFRQTSGKMNSPLRHITVLEEAHNLLKRTSTEQSSESSNLLGKSVEMLANAIAEMRTYGEGFIIADQSPGLLDMSVIRNTNTKIILRLPDQGDRELVGKAAGLNNDQIVELSKLQCGVAAVYQNDWIQPVLCKVEHFASPEKPYHYECNELLAEAQDSIPDELIQDVVVYLLGKSDLKTEEIDELKERVLRSNIENGLKLHLYNYLSTQKPTGNTETITDIIARLFPLESTALKRYKAGFPLTADWAESFYRELEPRLGLFNYSEREKIIWCIITEYAMKTGLKDLPLEWDKLDWRIR